MSNIYNNEWVGFFPDGGLCDTSSNLTVARNNASLSVVDKAVIVISSTLLDTVTIHELIMLRE